MNDEKEKVESSVSIWHRELNLFFVYGVIFLAGLAVVFIMVNVLNKKVEEMNDSLYYPPSIYNSSTN